MKITGKTCKNIIEKLEFLVKCQIIEPFVEKGTLHGCVCPWEIGDRSIAVFWGKSETTMLSDLLFGEGAITLGIGVFATVGGSKMSMSRQYPGQYYKEGEMMTDHVKSRPREIRIGVLILIVGAVLLGLSVLVGVLFGAV